MSETLGNEPVQLTPELIQERTGFKLVEIFTDFARSGRTSPDLHEERERLSVELGEDNVLTSMFVDEAGEVKSVYDFEKACRGPRALELARSLMINCFDNGWGDSQEADARTFLRAYQTESSITPEDLAQGLKIYMVRLAHMGWVEGQVLLFGSHSNDDVLQAHTTRFAHFHDDFAALSRSWLA